MVRINERKIAVIDAYSGDPKRTNIIGVNYDIIPENYDVIPFRRGILETKWVLDLGRPVHLDQSDRPIYLNRPTQLG